MRLDEIDNSVAPSRLAALVQFLIGRARDESGQKAMDLNSMIELAGNMGISLTAQQLQDLSLKSPLDALIKNVDMQQGRVYFRGGSGDDDIANDGSAKPMSPDQARKTVDNMAKRAAKKDL